MAPPLSVQKRFPWLLEKGSRVPFEELVHVFEAGTFEEECRDILSLFDNLGLEVGCKFARSGMPSVADKLQDPVGWYRQEVRRIPEMDSASEMRFCMGLEFLILGYFYVELPDGITKLVHDLYCLVPILLLFRSFFSDKSLY